MTETKNICNECGNYLQLRTNWLDYILKAVTPSLVLTVLLFYSVDVIFSISPEFSRHLYLKRTKISKQLKEARLSNFQIQQFERLGYLNEEAMHRLRMSGKGEHIWSYRETVAKQNQYKLLFAILLLSTFVPIFYALLNRFGSKFTYLQCPKCYKL